MRRFRLIRKEDPTGVSGVGRVAEGVLFTDGNASLRWLGENATTVVHPSMDTIENIHLHGGATFIEWMDPELLMAGPESGPLSKGMTAYAMDILENVPFASIGGLGARGRPVRPSHVLEEDWPMWLVGYLTAAREDAGIGWAEAKWGWAHALTLNEKEQNDE